MADTPTPHPPASHAADQSAGLPPRWAAPGLLLAVALLLGWRLGDFGITWDEQVQHHYGQLVLDYFLSGGQDTRCLAYKNLYLYGPLWELLAAAAERLTGGDRYLVRHAVTLLAALLAGLAVWRLAARWPNPWAAPLAVAALWLLPRWLGDSANNSKDIPLAAAFALTLLAGQRWLLGPAAWRWSAAILGGLALGATLAIREGGGVLVLAPLALAGLWRLWQLGEPGMGWRRLVAGARAVPRRAWWQLGLVLLLGYGVMLAVWPWAHQQPLGGPLAALREASQFSATYPVLYDGRQIPSDQLPRGYLPWYLLIATPPALLALAALGLGLLGLRVWQSANSVAPPVPGTPATTPPASPNQAAALLGVLLLAWLAVPLAFVLWRRPPLYDGLRHFLFLLPALAIAAGIGAAGLLAWLRQRVAHGWLAWLIVGGLLASPLPALWGLHPYQSSYFSPVIGGLAKAEGRYDTDYWAASYSEAGRWLATRIPDYRPLVVIVAANDNLLPALSHHLPATGVELHRVWTGREPLPESWDFFVGISRYGQKNRFPEAPIIHQIGRDGAVFTVIRAGPRQAAGLPQESLPAP